MIIDLEQARSQSLQCDVCIVGGGAAGITLALELERQGVSAVLLEGGGLNYPTSKELDLYDASVAEKSYPVSASRLRYFGGSTNHWGGWSRKLDPFDFESKPYFEHSGWPISRADLDPYYGLAADYCEITNLDKAHDGSYQSQLAASLLDLEGETSFCNKFFVFSPPTRFGTKYLPLFQTRDTLTLVLHANVTDLLVEDDTVRGVIARSLTGQQLDVTAKQTVLCMGGLENARFLLNHNARTAQNIGNQSDWLGRGFMDHPGFRPIELLLRDGLDYRRIQANEEPVMPVLSMDGEKLKELELNNFCMMLNRIKNDDALGESYADNPWFSKHPNGFGFYASQFIFEPTPSRDSRVTLTDREDVFGNKKLKLDWRFNERDMRSLERVVELLIKEFGYRGMGRVKWNKVFDDDTISKINGGMHHGGTTRMSADTADGVVNSDCAVHGTHGLYIAGNSVFPLIGFSNPTLTIVALAIRLSRHLKKQTG